MTITAPDLVDPSPALLEAMRLGYVHIPVKADDGREYAMRLDDLGWHAHRTYFGPYDPKAPITCPACNADYARKYPDAGPLQSLVIHNPHHSNKEK